VNSTWLYTNHPSDFWPVIVWVGSSHWYIWHSQLVWHLILLKLVAGVACWFGSFISFAGLFGFLLCHLVYLILGAGWPLFWTHACTGPLEDLLTLSVIFTQPLVSCCSPSSPKHLQREVLCDYPVVKSGLLDSQRACAGMVVLNPENQGAHNHKSQPYHVSASIGVSLTCHFEISKVQGNHYLCTLGRGSNSVITHGLHPKLMAEETANGPTLMIYRLDRGS